MIEVLLTVRNILWMNCHFSAVHLSVIHCQRSAAENLLSVLSTLPSDMAVNDRNDLLQVIIDSMHCVVHLLK